jgi:hypothetical protein
MDLPAEIQIHNELLGIKGGKGTLYIDKKRQPGRISTKKTLKLSPGQYLIEVKGRRRARVSIKVKAGDNVEIVADVRKGKATVR